MLAHNQENYGNPVHVIGDDVYVGSYLDDDVTPQPIGAVTGRDLGDVSLGRMSDWTVTVVSPSKTFALPTSRIAFAATTSARLRQAMVHYRTVFSFGRVPQVDELMATAALCLTPQEWINAWNRHYRAAAAALATRIDHVNTELGFDAFRLTPPQGGWYVSLRINRALFPVTVANGVDAFAVCLHYAPEQRDSGIALLPGELFGYGLTSTDEFTLRGTVAVDHPTLENFAHRLREMATALRRPGAHNVVDSALRRARKIAEIDPILRHRKF